MTLTELWKKLRRREPKNMAGKFELDAENKMRLLPARLVMSANSYRWRASSLWNTLSEELRSCQSFFKKNVKTWILEQITVPPDLGAVPPDLGAVPPDLGAVPPVLGAVPPDLGAVPPDLGAVPPDLGAVPPDLGAVPPDLGAVPPDLGAVPPDLGAVPPDLGAVPPDI